MSILHASFHYSLQHMRFLRQYVSPQDFVEEMEHVPNLDFIMGVEPSH